MISSLFYVAAYVNMECFCNQDKRSVYNGYWHDRNKEYLKSVTERGNKFSYVN